jgi:hypothetical protein
VDRILQRCCHYLGTYFSGYTSLLIPLDVNSLYPSVQVRKKYPIGPYKRITIKPKSRKERKWLNTLTGEPKSAHKELWNRVAACVDVTCPKNLNVPFLMERTADGEVVQNLHDKKATWWTGPELWEAKKLGYKFTRIHEVFVWKEAESIFDDFVKAAYETKASVSSTHPLYGISKSKMNSLTGKFGQKFTEEGLVFVRDQSELVGIDFYNLTEVMDKDGRILGFIASVKQETETACYPVQLTCFILGHSRCYMSRVLRNMNATTEPSKCPLYSDTDSWIVKEELLRALPAKRVGKKLGQLKSEVDGKIIYFCALAPKTYLIIFVVEETLEVKCRVRCKGIPHPSDDYNAFDHFDSTMQESAVNHYNLHASGSDMTGANIKERNYFFFDKDGQIAEVTSRIPSYMFPRILDGEVSMQLLFGAMERKFNYSNLDQIAIAPTYKARTLYKTPWWESGKRIYLPNAGRYDVAFPPGHKQLANLEEQEAEE